MNRVTITEGGCWDYAGLGPNGYGYISIGNKRQLVHRVMYELDVAPIPEGMVIDHLCKRPSCCYPPHLEPVPQRINIIRGTADLGNMARADQRTHCKHGHEFTPENTYWYRVGRGPMRGRGTRGCRVCKNRRQRDYIARKKQPPA